MKNRIEKFKVEKENVVSEIEKFPGERRLDILFDKWCLKDIVAHLSNWIVHDVDCLNALKEGREPYWELEVDEFNRKGVEARKDRNWNEVYEEFVELGSELIKLYETLPDELWNKPIWKGKNETAKSFLDEDIAHWGGEHLGDLKEKLEVATASWITPKARVRLSDVGGKGLFAVTQIKENEKVVVWKGNYVNKQVAEKAKGESKLVMRWDEDLFSIEDRGEDIGYYINHSCDPNLWMQDAYTLVARQDIKEGEEITADYALWEADENYVSKWECVCGSKLCRKRITGKDWRLLELQERYKSHFSPLINGRIRKL